MPVAGEEPLAEDEPTLAHAPTVEEPLAEDAVTEVQAFSLEAELAKVLEANAPQARPAPVALVIAPEPMVRAPAAPTPPSARPPTPQAPPVKAAPTREPRSPQTAAGKPEAAKGATDKARNARSPNLAGQVLLNGRRPLASISKVHTGVLTLSPALLEAIRVAAPKKSRSTATLVIALALVCFAIAMIADPGVREFLHLKAHAAATP
jgi:hypothetical protein